MLDADIREPLFDYLEERYGKVRTIEEKIIRKSRADVLAVIDGYIIGMEIKSDSDSYTRLERQIKDYNVFCDYCYVVVGEKHIHVDKKIPDFWGIITVTNDNVILDREATLCPKVKLYNQLDLLWRNELLNIQLKHELPKLRNVRRRDIYDRLIARCGEETIKKDLTQELFERDYTIFDEKRTIKEKEQKDAAKKNKSTATSQNKKSKRIRKKRKSIISEEKKRLHVTYYVAPKKHR